MCQSAIPINKVHPGKWPRRIGSSIDNLRFIGRVVVSQPLDANHSGSSVLGTADLLLDKQGLLGGSLQYSMRIRIEVSKFLKKFASR